MVEALYPASVAFDCGVCGRNFGVRLIPAPNVAPEEAQGTPGHQGEAKT